jgi:O-antigen/teichoic acid export membrane protein
MNKAALIITLGRVIQMMIALVSVRIYTSMLSTGEVGNLYLINSLFGFFGLALINPVGMYMNRKMHRWSEEKTILNRFVIFNLFLTIVTICSVGIIFLLHRYGKVGSLIPLSVLVVFIMLSIYFTTWNQLIVPTLNLLNHRISFVGFTLLTLGLGLFFSILLVHGWEPTAVAWLSGQLTAQALVSVLAFLYLRKLVGESDCHGGAASVVTRDNLGHVLNFVIPLAMTTFFMWMQNQSYRIVIEKMLGAEFLGSISLGIGVASSIAVAAESLIQQLYLPVFYKEINTQDGDQRTAAWNSLAQLTIPLYISLTIMVFCLAPFLVNILVSAKFSGIYIFVMFGAWSEFFRMTINTLTSVAHAEMRTRYLLRAYCVGGVLTLCGTYLGSMLPSYAVAIPTLLLVSGFISMMIMYRDMRRLMPMKVGIRRIRKSILLSLPFAAVLPFFRLQPNLPLSLILVGLSGCYFLLIQYRLSQPILKERLL